VTNADRIIARQNRTIAETGQHSELVARGGCYASLVRRQNLEPIANDAA
jgi:ABC-type multidrug transport system fused ATPase/permease subunit